MRGGYDREAQTEEAPKWRGDREYLDSAYDSEDQHSGMEEEEEEDDEDLTYEDIINREGGSNEWLHEDRLQLSTK